MRTDRKKLILDVYDQDGVKVRSIEGIFTAGDLADEMLDVLEEDRIPVVRLLGATGGVHEPHQATYETMPMALRYEFDGIKFHAAGHPLDVHTANNALLSRVFDEGKDFEDGTFATPKGEAFPKK